jgi:amino-acid N-acetyltransferase
VSAPLPAGPAVVRPARTSDVRAVRTLVDAYSSDGRLLSKATVTLFEDVPDFLVAELDGEVVGCGAVHVMWEDLAEVRTLAVDPRFVGRGIGAALLSALMDRARDLGVKRVFCLTFMVRFFAAHGFVEIDDTPIDTAVYEQLLQSYDEGVAEFLGLERVKPNTLGNHRMLAVL